MRNEPFVAGFGILLVEAAGRSRRIELHRGVVHRSRAGEKLPRSDVTRAACLDRQHEVSIDVLSRCAQRVGCRLEDEVRLPELPLAVPCGRTREQRGVTFDEWRKATGIDGETTFKLGYPTGTRVVVRPNRYEKGRANVAVYNWNEAEAVEIDLSKVLAAGQSYKIVSAQNFFGEPVTAGTYDGKPVRLPLET